MTITREKDVLSIGQDFVDCMIGKYRSAGEVTIDGRKYCWRAVVDCGAAEHFIRRAATGHKLTYFSAQALP